jgi:hypothetical protein
LRIAKVGLETRIYSFESVFSGKREIFNPFVPDISQLSGEEIQNKKEEE